MDRLAHYGVDGVLFTLCAIQQDPGPLSRFRGHNAERWTSTYALFHGSLGLW